MKKLVIVLLALFLVPTVAQAQYGGKGSMDINAGIGLGSNLNGSGIPVSVALDYGYNESISIGGYLGYASTKEDFGAGTWKYSNLIIGARGAYHHELTEKADTYGGIMLGYNIASAKWDGPGTASASVGGLTYSAFVGARYSFTEKIGAFGELGYGIAFLQFGATIRL